MGQLLSKSLTHPLTCAQSLGNFYPTCECGTDSAKKSSESSGWRGGWGTPRGGTLAATDMNESCEKLVEGSTLCWGNFLRKVRMNVASGEVGKVLPVREIVA